MRLLPIFAIIVLATCGRPLTEGELAFTALVHGQTLDPSTIRLHEGLAPEPPREIPVRPRLACRDRLFPAPETPTIHVRTSAIAIFQNVHFRDTYYLDDYLRGFPDRLNLAAAMIFAHEMVHLWQWQNRAVTGYHPLRAVLEHVASPDPYLFDTSTEAAFQSFGYEQQAAILEEFICCAAVAPAAPRTSRLRNLLSPYFALPPEGAPLASDILLPWKDADLTGICD